MTSEPTHRLIRKPGPLYLYLWYYNFAFGGKFRKRMRFRWIHIGVEQVGNWIGIVQPWPWLFRRPWPWLFRRPRWWHCRRHVYTLGAKKIFYQAGRKNTLWSFQTLGYLAVGLLLRVIQRSTTFVASYCLALPRTANSTSSLPNYLECRLNLWDMWNPHLRVGQESPYQKSI